MHEDFHRFSGVVCEWIFFLCKRIIEERWTTQGLDKKNKTIQYTVIEHEWSNLINNASKVWLLEMRRSIKDPSGLVTGRDFRFAYRANGKIKTRFWCVTISFFFYLCSSWNTEFQQQHLTYFVWVYIDKKLIYA